MDNASRTDGAIEIRGGIDLAVKHDGHRLVDVGRSESPHHRSTRAVEAEGHCGPSEIVDRLARLSDCPVVTGGVRHALFRRDVQEDETAAVFLSGDKVVSSLEVADWIRNQGGDRFWLVLVGPLLQIIDREPSGDG